MHHKQYSDIRSCIFAFEQKPVFHKKAKVTKKITLKMKCEKCSTFKMKNIGRCKHFELGAEKKKKGPTIHGR